MHIHMGGCPGNIVKQINKCQSNLCIMPLSGGFPGGTNSKEPTLQCRRHKRQRFGPWIRKIPWRRKWQSTPVFLPGESQGPRSLGAAVHRVAKSQTRLEQLNNHTYILRRGKRRKKSLWLLYPVFQLTQCTIHQSMKARY